MKEQANGWGRQKHLSSLKSTQTSTLLKRSYFLLPVVLPSEWLLQSFLSRISLLGISVKKKCQSTATELCSGFPTSASLPAKPQGSFCLRVLWGTHPVSFPVSLILVFQFPSFSSVQFSRSVMSDSLRPHESQHARPPCPSPTPGVYSNSCPSSRWCHPAISSSVIPFSSCPQSLPASGSFPMSQLFAWDGQSTGVSASASVLPTLASHNHPFLF